MSIFAIEKLDVIKDGGALSFYKVLISGVCLFDEFCKKTAKSTEGKKKLTKIYSFMNYMAENNNSLPESKFNSIKNKQKVFGYEFKEKDIRIYVLKKDPNVYIVLGGYKKNQNSDVDTLLDIVETKDLNEFITQLHLQQSKKDE